MQIAIKRYNADVLGLVELLMHQGHGSDPELQIGQGNI